jgi:hypothetical protein
MERGHLPALAIRAAAAATVAFLAVLALSVTAPAAHAEVPELLTELSLEGSATGSGAGQFSSPQGIATNPSDGHFYVADLNNQRIDEFTPWGVFVRAWGWGVNTGAAEAQSCTTASTCQAGIAGSGNGQFSYPTGVAVDSTGDVYVVDGGNHRIEKFDSEGNFLLAWGSDVVAGGPDDSATDEEQEVVIAAGSGSFKLSLKDPLGGSQTATTSSLPFNATAAEVQVALNALSTIASHGGSVSVSGGPGDGTGSSPYLITFEGSLAGDDVPQLRLDRSSLGASQPGARLVCSTTDTEEVKTLEYQWLRNGQLISGATSPTYVTGSEDEGKAIQCQVAAINPNTGETVTSNPAYVAPPAPATSPPVAPDSISVERTSDAVSIEHPGGTISCPGSGWQNATSLSYRWYRNGNQIVGATGQSYEVTEADLATRATFQCVVIGGNGGGSVVKASERLDTYPDPSPLPPSVEVGLEPVRTVVQGGGPEICSEAAGDACKAGDLGWEDGEFREWPFSSSLIAIGPGDTVYVGDTERIQEFEPSGAFKAALPLPEGIVHALTLAPSGNIYVDFQYRSLRSEPVFQRELLLRELDPSGTEIASLDLGGELNGRVTLAFAQGLATDPSGDVYIAGEVANILLHNQIFELDPEGNPLIPLGSEFPIPAGEGTVNAQFHGIATNGVGDLLFDWREGASAQNPPGDYLNIYGPSPISYEPPPPAQPEILDQYAVTTGTVSAEVGAKINSRFWPDASYRVQYGTGPCFEGGCAETAPAPLSAKSVNSGLLTAPVKLSGLEQGTTYHYRFVAQSGGGGPAFGLAGKSGAEAEGTLRTYREAPAALPDSRAYELVSPPDKDGGEVGTPGSASGGAEFSVQPLQASPSGAAITYSSFTAFGEGPESAPASSQYLSSLGAPWSTDNLNPRFEEGFTRDPLVGFSEDLTHAAVIAIEPPLTEDATKGFPNLYVRDNATGALTAITTEAHRPEVAVADHEYCLAFEGASADYGHVFFANKGALNPGDPVPSRIDDFNLYEWSASEGLHLASVLPDGTAATPGSSSFGAGGHVGASDCNPRSGLLRHAVSADGSKAFWTYEGTYEVSPGVTAIDPLFARVNGAQTVELDARQSPLTGAGGGGVYQDASRDGSRAFFIDAHKLTSTATPTGSADLYRYDFNRPLGSRLANLTGEAAHLAGEAAGVQGAIGASEDGAYVYFVATGVLDTTPNAQGEAAAPGAHNLYAWHEGKGIRFLARLAGTDGADWSAEPEKQTAAVSPDGTHLALLSSNPLSGFDNLGAKSGEADAEAFLYSYEANQLRCASCNAAGTRPLGAASLPAWSTPYQGPRYLSGDGSRLFFETKDALSPDDENEKRDVYEFERPGSGSCSEADPAFNPTSGGCQLLISSGQSKDESYFLDASSNGDGAFFSTREGLVQGDTDGRYDVYDARVGGSSPQPPPPPCEGEACREASTGPAASSPPGTLGFRGPENPAPSRCPKGRRALGTGGKTRCAKPKKPHHRHRRRSR